MTVKVEIEGGKELAKRFAEMGQKATNAAEKALVKGGLLVERDAKILCPVDTGRLRASITHRLEGAGTNEPAVEVGTNVEYAPFVEFGHAGREAGKTRSGATVYTGGARAKPFLFPAFNANKDKVKQLVADAIHKELGGK